MKHAMPAGSALHFPWRIRLLLTNRERLSWWQRLLALPTVRLPVPKFQQPLLPRRFLRMSVATCAVLLVCLRLIAPVHAQSSKDCANSSGQTQATVGESVSCTLRVDLEPAEIAPFDSLVIEIPTGKRNYEFVSVSTCTALPSNATCSAVFVSASNMRATCTSKTLPTPVNCTSFTITETIRIVSREPSTGIAERITVRDATSALATFELTAPFSIVVLSPSTTYFVSPAPDGKDVLPDGTANRCNRETVPCATIKRAHEVAIDGDIISLFAGTYTITETIKITKLVTIQPKDSGKVILRARGIVIFEISASGGVQKKVSISSLNLGGLSSSEPAEAAFRLVNDSFTQIFSNLIGGDDLPVRNGIILNNSDHASIDKNVIQGNQLFIYTPTLVVGQNVTGFGVVAAECLGQLNGRISDRVSITSNQFSNLWLAAIWLCSDGGGEHQITDNTIRNQYRGIVLKDTTNALVKGNTVIDGRSDGIIIYGASLRNTIDSNTIESHVGPDAAAIRVGWVADPIMPLSNTLTNNIIIRATVGIHVFGARTTIIKSGNRIKLAGARTGILITPSTFAGDPGTQPRNTEITGNEIIFSGPCAALLGCAVRLVGVTVPVLGTGNDWGLRYPYEVEGVIYHQNDDPALGLVTFEQFTNQVTPSPTPTPRPGNGTPGPGGIPGLIPGIPGNGTPTPLPTTTPTPGNGSNFPPGTTTIVDLVAGCQMLRWQGISGVSIVDAILSVTPTSVQETIVVWKQENNVWRGFGPGIDRRAPTDVFNLRRSDVLQVCVADDARWVIPVEGG